jgi:DtxR family Mn-dependent transcriptional regulator
VDLLTPTQENYMKTIYKIHQSGSENIIHVSDIAAEMRLRKASVCRATDVLAEKGFVRKDNYKGLYFKKKGLRYALYIEQRYSVITRFLNQALGIELKTAQKDVCGIEHVISVECYRSMCAFLQEQAAL